MTITGVDVQQEPTPESVYAIGTREREEVGVENPDEPLSWSARNEDAGLSFRVRTSSLFPCVVMRGLRCIPLSEIRVASCIIPISVLSFWRDAYGVAWHTGGVVRWIAALA